MEQPVIKAAFTFTGFFPALPIRRHLLSGCSRPETTVTGEQRGTVEPVWDLEGG